MRAGVVQTLWAAAMVEALAAAGVEVVVVSPGSRSTPIAAAVTDAVVVVDERSAAFYALGAARATGRPTAVVCTSGTAAAHYLPALIEAAEAGVPVIAVTADRPPELRDCGANQTIDQVGMYGGFVRGAFDLGPPEASVLAFRAMRRKVSQAVALACGPRPGPVHLEVPLRKPLEPMAPGDDAERAFAASIERSAVSISPPRLAPDRDALMELAAAVEAEPRGLIVVGAMPVGFGVAREAVFQLAQRSGYPIAAEAGSQLRYGPRPEGVVFVDHLEMALASGMPAPGIVIQLGAEPVAAGWMSLPGQRWVLATEVRDPESVARVILGDAATAIAMLAAGISSRTDHTYARACREMQARVAAAISAAIEQHPTSELALMRAIIGALPAKTTLQLGNSLPVRVIEHVAGGGAARSVLTQRGVSGIDGMLASACGATRAGQPVVLVTGDVSFAHDVGSLAVARRPHAPLVVIVVDNGGGRIFDSLPVANAGLAGYRELFTTPPELDIVAIASAFGARAIRATSPAESAAAMVAGLATQGLTVIHAPVAPDGARDAKRTALDLVKERP